MTTPNMIKENPAKPMDYGFSSQFDDLSKISPRKRKPKKASPKANKSGQGAAKKPKALKTQNPVSADTVAKAHGFSSREAIPLLLKKRRRTHHDEPVDQLSIRGPVRILNNFIIYCEKQGLSYWEGLEALLQPHLLSKK